MTITTDDCFLSDNFLYGCFCQAWPKMYNGLKLQKKVKKRTGVQDAVILVPQGRKSGTGCQRLFFVFFLVFLLFFDFLGVLWMGEVTLGVCLFSSSV